MFFQLFISPLVTQSAKTVEVFVRCEAVTKNGTPGKKFLVKECEGKS
jgi:hypothetical protein